MRFCHNKQPFIPQVFLWLNFFFSNILFFTSWTTPFHFLRENRRKQTFGVAVDVSPQLLTPSLIVPRWSSSLQQSQTGRQTSTDQSTDTMEWVLAASCPNHTVCSALWYSLLDAPLSLFITKVKTHSCLCVCKICTSIPVDWIHLHCRN